MVNTIQHEGFLRLPQIIGNPKANPPIPALIPISSTSWWAGVKSGKYPKSIKLGSRTTVWRASEVLALVTAPAAMRFAADGQTAPASAGNTRIFFAPEGDKRLSINLKVDLHKRLKLAALDKGVTAGELIEQFIEQHL